MIKLPYIFWKGRYCPIIEVEVINKNKEIRTLVFVDT